MDPQHAHHIYTEPLGHRGFTAPPLKRHLSQHDNPGDANIRKRIPEPLALPQFRNSGGFMMVQGFRTVQRKTEIYLL